MEYSSGILCIKKDKGDTKFFVCSPGGPFWKNKESWSFPKGHIEEGENPADAAYREFKEETGVSVTGKIKYIGRVKQNNKKHVYVYITFDYPEDLNQPQNCYSNTFIDEKDGKEYPEIGKYEWMTADEIIQRGCPKVYIDMYKALSDSDESVINNWINEHNIEEKDYGKNF